MRLFFYLFPLGILVLILLGSCTPDSTQSESQSSTKTSFFAANDPHIRYVGRVDKMDSNKVRFSWSGTSIQVRFTGTSCKVRMTNTCPWADQLGYKPHNEFQVIIDGKPTGVISIKPNQSETTIAENLSEGTHTLELFKRTEAEMGHVVFEGIELAEGGELLDPPAPKPHSIEFIGNSITCGYGNEGDDQDCPFSPETENAWMTYSAITARNLNADYVSICFSGKGMIRNYDRTSKETLPKIYDRIIAQENGSSWDFSQWQPEIVVVNLGTNDFAHKIANEKEFVATYTAFLRGLRMFYPDAKIVCLTGSMMSGEPLKTLQGYLSQVMEQMRFEEEADVYRFDLSTQGELGYGCSWHPNVAQHQKNAEELTAFLAELL